MNQVQINDEVRWTSAAGVIAGTVVKHRFKPECKATIDSLLVIEYKYNSRPARVRQCGNQQKVA
jgi:hypothetical protein